MVKFPIKMNTLIIEILVMIGMEIQFSMEDSYIDADGSLEYCETELFHAECTENEVVIIQNAQYGRMKFGRCVERDYGYVGCSANVMKIADRWCSGRRSCDIPIPNSAFRSTNPCPKDLKPYFEASYKCIAVETGGDQNCDDTGFLKLRNREGYLARMTTEDTGRGSATCPWLIEAAPGQFINITLIDFSHTGSDSSNYLHDDSGICHVTAIFREKGDSSDVTTVCSGGGRQKQVYTSLTDALEVRILGVKSSREPSYFLLKYEVIGCDDPIVPDGYWVSRRGDVAEIGCQNSERFWMLECEGNDWIGQYDNCSLEAPGGVLGEVVLGSILMPFEASVVMIVSIAVIMGIIILVSGLICLRWRLSRRVQQKTNGTTVKAPRSPLVVNGNSYQPDKRTSASQESFPPPPPEVDRQSTLLRDHDYSYISDVPPPPPPATNIRNGTANIPPPLSAGHNPPHSPRTASTTVSQSSPGSYQSYKCYIQNLQNQNNMNYERMPPTEYTETPPGSPAPTVPMPKLLAHECALAIRGDKSVMLNKKRHSRGHGSISSETGSINHSPRRSKGGTPTYYELEPDKSTAFPFPPPPVFATISSPKNPRNQHSQHHHQQGIYHVRSPKRVDGKNTL